MSDLGGITTFHKEAYVLFSLCLFDLKNLAITNTNLQAAMSRCRGWSNRLSIEITSSSALSMFGSRMKSKR